MARGVDHVDNEVLAVLAQTLAVDSGVLRQNGDAALALLVIGVHDAIRVLAMVAKSAGLLQHSVDEGGFTVINVCDDGYVTELSVTHVWGAP